MKLRAFSRSSSGSAAVEFALTAPAFFAMLFVLIGAARVMWVQVGIQNAAEMAARCRSVNTTLCASVSATQTYAATQALGLAVPASSFTVSTPACGVQVSVSYTVVSVTGYLGMPSLTLSGQSCFPV